MWPRTKNAKEEFLSRADTDSVLGVVVKNTLRLPKLPNKLFAWILLLPYLRREY